MTHPAFTTSFENREMFGWPTQPQTRSINITLTNKQWVLLAAVLGHGCSMLDTKHRKDAGVIYNTMTSAIFPE